MIFFQFLKLSKETQAIHDSHCRDGLCPHEKWGIRVCKKPQNRTNDNKRKRKTEINFDQNRKPEAKLEKTCTWLRLLKCH